MDEGIFFQIKPEKGLDDKDKRTESEKKRCNALSEVVRNLFREEDKRLDEIFEVMYGDTIINEKSVPNHYSRLSLRCESAIEHIFENHADLKKIYLSYFED